MRQIFKRLEDANTVPDPKDILIHGENFIVTTGTDIDYRPLPVIRLTNAQARNMLRRAGYFDFVQTVVDGLGNDVKTSFEFEPYIDSDNALVLEVLGSGIGLSSDSINRLFVEALTYYS